MKFKCRLITILKVMALISIEIKNMIVIETFNDMNT